jgi:hypothetical protein
VADPTITVRGRSDFSAVQSGLGKLRATAVAAVAGVAAAGAAAAREAVNQQREVARSAAALGANPEQQKRLGKIAGRLYGQAYGESFAEVAGDVEAVKSAFRGLGGRELEDVTRRAIGVADVFQYDLPSAVSTASVAVKSGLAKNATEALDLITRTSQKVPAALRENVLEAVDEYAPFFADLGFTGSQAFATIAAGAAKGQYGIDKVGDSVKEFGIRATDMSTSSVAAYDAIGLNAEDMADRLLAGGTSAQEATRKIIRGLLSIESPSKRANSAIALFGTPIEDLGVKGIPDFLRSLADGQKGLDDFEGAADRAGNTLNDTTAVKLTALKRTVQQAIIDEVGKRALPVLDDLADAGTNIADAWARGGVDAAVREVERLTGAQGRLTPMLEAGQSVLASVEKILRKVGPAALDASDGLGFLASPLSLIDDAFSAIATVVDAIPDGLLALGIQAGAAALILPRLTAAIVATGGAMTTATMSTLSFTAAMRAAGTPAHAAAVGRIGSVAKQAAGIGGILALTSGMSEASAEGTTMSSVLKGAAGGAGIGAMFGPIGALVGAGAGVGLTALTGAFAETTDEAEKTRLELLRTEGLQNAKDDADSLAQALAGVANAYGETSRAAVKASFTGEDGKLDADIAKLRELGVSMDSIVSATLGQADAQRVVDQALAGNIEGLTVRANEAKAAYDLVKMGSREVVDQTGRVIGRQQLSNEQVKVYEDAWRKAKAAVDEASILQGTFGSRIEETGGTIEAYRSKVEGLAEALGLTVRQYRQFPQAVRTEIEAEDLPETARGALRLIERYQGLQRFDRIRAVISAPGVDLTGRQVRTLGRTYGLVPKQVRTLLRLEGVDAAARQARRASEGVKSIEKARPNLDPMVKGVLASLRSAEQGARRGAGNVNRELRDGTRRARADLGPFGASVSAGLGPIRGIAAAGGRGIGGDLKAGIFAGFGGTASALAAEARAAVRAAITAGRQEGKIRSPSRETRYIGEMLGKGLADGMNARRRDAEKNGRDLVAAALAGVTAGSDGVGKSLDKLTRLIEKRIDLKDDQKERQRERAVLRALRDEYAALTKIGKRQDANQRQLDRAKETLKGKVDAANAYAAAIKAGIVGYGGVVGLGQLEDGTVSTSALLDQLRDREADAKRFEALINSLRNKLNPTALQELLDRGLEGGALQTAEAIAAGGDAAIKEINALTSSIATVGGRLGETMRKQFHQAGINAAAGLVAGFEREQAKLDRIAQRLASKLAAAVRKELGIKSPSRVMRGIGEDAMAGLEIGLDDTRARRAGVSVARALETGVARPSLVATVAGGAGGSGETLTLVLTGEAQSDLRSGKSISVQVDVGRAAGVRRLAVGGA